MASVRTAAEERLHQARMCLSVMRARTQAIRAGCEISSKQALMVSAGREI